MRTKVIVSVTLNASIAKRMRDAVKADKLKLSPVVEALCESYLTMLTTQKELAEVADNDPLGLRTQS